MEPLGGNRARNGRQIHPVDRLMVMRAGRAHGVLGTDELLTLGLNRKGIRRRARNGWLTELYPDAYAVGHHNLTRRSDWRAAVLSCGDGSVLSHRAGAQLERLADLIPGPPHVTIPHGRTLRRSGIVVHRTRDLPASQVTTVDGIPVTTVARTLLDFASQATQAELRDAVRAAKRKELLDVPLAAEMCRNARGRRGAGQLRALLEADHGPLAEVRSPLEHLFLPICADFGIRYPQINAPVLDYEVDCLWLPEMLIVELDGWEWHRDRASFEADRRRDARLGAAGHHVCRLTHERLTMERAAAAAEVAALLARLGRHRSTP